jgi:hypothetical protein
MEIQEVQMKIALWFLALIGVLVYIWLRNTTPKWALYRLGTAVGIPHADMMPGGDIAKQLHLVHSELRQKYATLYYGIRDLIYDLPDKKLRNELEEMLQPASEHDVDNSTWIELNEALARIEEAGVPGQHLTHHLVLQAQSYRLEDLFARYYRIERRLG